MTQLEKVCVLCGESCAGQPRIKDTNGNYAHRACAASQQDSQPAAEQDGLGLDGGMHGLLDDLASMEQDAAGAANACPGCGLRVDLGTVVCMNCGFNMETGKGLKTKTIDKKPKRQKSNQQSDLEEGKLASLGSDLVDLGMKPIFPLIGALIGGAIGAGIWATIAYTTGYEVGFVAILVGAMCGTGARLGGGAETTGGGMIAGILAAGMALFAIGAGKYIALSMIIDRDYGGNLFGAQDVSFYNIEEDDILGHMAFSLCEEKINNGVEISWDDPGLPIDVALWPDDYSVEMQDRVMDRWDGMGESGQLQYRRDIARENGLHSYRDVDLDWAVQVLADETAWNLIELGEPIEWPNQHLYNESAVWPYDYPSDIQDEVKVQWASLTTEDQEQKRQDAVDAYNNFVSEVESATSDITLQAALASFKSPRQLLSLFFGLMLAYSIGNND